MADAYLVKDATRDLVQKVNTVREGAADSFAAARQLVRRLGAHLREDGHCEIGFWVPECAEAAIESESIYLELYTPLTVIDFSADEQRVRFRRQRLSPVLDGEFLWGVIAGMTPGTRDQVGTLYRVCYRDQEGSWHTVVDYLAYSVPFGLFAPSEYYDIARLDAERTDRAYFSQLELEPDPDGVPRLGPPVNILQLHTTTASREGTIAGLTHIYSTIADKLRAGRSLSPAEQNYIGYDAVELMPIEPTIEYEEGPGFWEPIDEDPASEEITVRLRRPDMTNWGYDVITAAMSATNPVVLGSRRPDELVDFIATLHSFPGKPIKVVFDIVYGHADNQSLPLLNHHFFAGANMYGQNINFLHPVVRAILPEMQRRKHNLGVDGVRVDGAQDFKWWDPETDKLYHDDEFLRIMNDVDQHVAGQRYRPWMIFEDGRPWPRDDWELASTYREVTARMPNVWQWGPLTFAHNTPFLFTFWISKWWRIREITRVGRNWITGCANHDTLRRGTQVDPTARINTYLGDDLPAIFRNAYDNPAARLFDYAIMPGIPMDFINASMRAPWAFIRNTDDRYGVKVVSEEARFLDWAMRPNDFAEEMTFPRLKALGFTDLDALRHFMQTLDHAVQITGYNLDAMVKILDHVVPPLPGAPYLVAGLKRVARAWMDDVHAYCNVSRYEARLDAQRTGFNLLVREFRRARPWLMENFGPQDRLDYQFPTDGAVLFYGWRYAPDNGERLLFLANMEGAPRSLTPRDLIEESGLPTTGWEVALRTPGLAVGGIDQALTLEDSQGVVFTHGDLI
ncbi:MAG: hypothetical protein GYB66_11230 [Chloroflexi bacterium]|nr:hypothetical protein [Chloroflexota bacterium]